MRPLELAPKYHRIDSRRHAARVRRQRRFLVESLEDRTLLTILFTPQNGAETANDGGGARLGTVPWGMPLYTIYWGSWWTNTSDGQTLQTQIQSSLNSIFYNSAILSGLHQYGVTYPAGVNGSGTVEVNNTSDPTDGFSRDWLLNTINYAIDNQGLPDSDGYSNEGLYVVFTPPNIHCWNSGLTGDHSNESGWDPFPFDYDTRHWAWVGDFGGLNGVTSVLTHEVIEAMTDPNGDAIQVLPRNSSSWNEVCDNEAQNYSAFVNGYQVQSFWSQSDGNYAVYDGNSQTVTDGAGDLIVNGDQLGANYNDTISVDQNSEGGVLVNLNGQFFSFPSGEINQITLNPGGGNDTINILNTSSGVPVTINEAGGNDSVYISPSDQFLDHIQGNVTVNGGWGYDSLTIDDQNEDNSFLESYTLTPSSFARPGSALISYSGMNVVTVNGSRYTPATYTISGTESAFTTNVNVDSNASTNAVYVQGTGTSSTLNVTSASSDTVNVQNTGSWGLLNITSNGHSTVNLGDNGNVQGIYGTVNIENPPSYTALNIDDSADPNGHSNVVLDTFTPSGDSPWGSVTGLAPGSINYEYDDTSSVSITTGVLADTINVHATGVTTNLSSGSGDYTVNVGNGGSVQNILGTLNIENPPSFTTLTLDDSADSTGRTVWLNTFTSGSDTPWASITGLAPAAINYEQNDIVSPVTIKGGLGGNTFNVVALPSQSIDLNTGGGNDKVNVQTTSGSLIVNGQGGNNTLVGPNANETWNITGTNAGTVGGVSFSNVQNLTGGTGNDLFVFSNSKGVTGTINGGGGTNELDYAAYTSAVTVNLASHTATGTGGFSGIETLDGGTGSNKLIGPNATNTWNITGTNAGNVAGVTFSAFPNLTGGTGMDVFVFSAGKNVTGAINGGGGGDWLDYALYTTAVMVNLTTGAATGVGGGVTNIQNVRAGSGGCTLTGNAQGNILIGGSGALTINGGSGRSILIADNCAGHINGGSGTDILIGAKTSYDASTLANDIALADILAEWQSGNNYVTRISNIKNGLGLTAGHKLRWGFEVKDNGMADVLTAFPTPNPPVSPLVGDWFFKGAATTIKNKESYEVIN
jgi:hypothetical protein